MEMENTVTYTQDVSSSKFLAKVFGYMFIGLLISAVVAFGWSFGLAYFCLDTDGYLTDQGCLIALITGLVCLFGSIIISVVNSLYSAKTGKAPWVGFILYAVFMGGVFSLVLLGGISLSVVAEAFFITALAFGSMFLVGYFSKSNLNWLALVASGLGIGLMMTSLFWGIFYLISPAAGLFLDWVISVGVLVVLMIFVAVDSYNIKKLAENGNNNTNIALFCAFNMYSDFLMVFIRILYLLAATSKKR